MNNHKGKLEGKDINNDIEFLDDLIVQVHEVVPKASNGVSNLGNYSKILSDGSQTQAAALRKSHP